jgi:hypothetical protein
MRLSSLVSTCNCEKGEEKEMRDLKEIKELDPYNRFLYYINERINIRNRRQQGKPQEEWTLDPILREYKFTNARRAWDYTSRWLIKNWYATHTNAENVSIAAAFARFFCFVPTFELVGFPNILRNTLPSKSARLWLRGADEILTDAQHSGKKVFTSAYVIGGVKGGHTKVSWVIHEYLIPVLEDRILRSPWRGPIDELHHELRQFNGWGDFMTQEVILDLMYTFVLKDKSTKEKAFYAWAGPGALRGLSWLFGFEIKNRDQARDLMVQTWEKMRDDLRLSATLRQKLTVHDIEFNLCEFDKYSRTLFGKGTPKQKFNPRQTGEPELVLR